MNYPKPVRKRLRELAAVAYEKELSAELGKLAEKFALWKEGKINAWELEEAVHKFHNGPARKLYDRYAGLPPETIIPYALARGLVSYGDLPGEIVEEMRMKASFFSKK